MKREKKKQIKKAIAKVKVDGKNIQQLKEIFGDDIESFMFYLYWIKNGLNASKAYKELHKNVNMHSASVLGSKALGKISKELILQAYGLDIGKYMTQLKKGMDAEKWNDFTGEREADHRTRFLYHDRLGKLLGIVTDKPVNNIQVNVMPILGGETIKR